jgi:hypothetical protein
MTKSKSQKPTWDNVSSIHRIIVFNEAESTHELDLRDLTRAMMSVEVIFDFLFGDWKENPTPNWAPFYMSALHGQKSDPGKHAQMPGMSGVCSAIHMIFFLVLPAGRQAHPPLAHPQKVHGILRAPKYNIHILRKGVDRRQYPNHVELAASKED